MLSDQDIETLKKLAVCLEHDIVEGASMNIQHDKEKDEYTLNVVYKGWDPSRVRK